MLARTITKTNNQLQNTTCSEILRILSCFYHIFLRHGPTTPPLPLSAGGYTTLSPRAPMAHPACHVLGRRGAPPLARGNSNLPLLFITTFICEINHFQTLLYASNVYYDTINIIFFKKKTFITDIKVSNS